MVPSESFQRAVQIGCLLSLWTVQQKLELEIHPYVICDQFWFQALICLLSILHFSSRILQFCQEFRNVACMALQLLALLLCSKKIWVWIPVSAHCWILQHIFLAHKKDQVGKILSRNECTASHHSLLGSHCLETAAVKASALAVSLAIQLISTCYNIRMVIATKYKLFFFIQSFFSQVRIYF